MPTLASKIRRTAVDFAEPKLQRRRALVFSVILLKVKECGRGSVLTRRWRDLLDLAKIVRRDRET